MTADKAFCSCRVSLADSEGSIEKDINISDLSNHREASTQSDSTDVHDAGRAALLILSNASWRLLKGSVASLHVLLFDAYCVKFLTIFRHTVHLL